MGCSETAADVSKALAELHVAERRAEIIADLVEDIPKICEGGLQQACEEPSKDEEKPAVKPDLVFLFREHEKEKATDLCAVDVDALAEELATLIEAGGMTSLKDCLALETIEEIKVETCATAAVLSNTDRLLRRALGSSKKDYFEEAFKAFVAERDLTAETTYCNTDNEVLLEEYKVAKEAADKENRKDSSSSSSDDDEDAADDEDDEEEEEKKPKKSKGPKGPPKGGKGKSKKGKKPKRRL